MFFSTVFYFLCLGGCSSNSSGVSMLPPCLTRPWCCNYRFESSDLQPLRLASAQASRRRRRKHGECPHSRNLLLETYCSRACRLRCGCLPSTSVLHLIQSARFAGLYIRCLHSAPSVRFLHVFPGWTHRRRQNELEHGVRHYQNERAGLMLIFLIFRMWRRRVGMIRARRHSPRRGAFTRLSMPWRQSRTLASA